jgi:dTDP-4-amino-4,6-dideoxygalactose transaminase
LKLIPQTDPGASFRKHKSAIEKAVRRVLESGWYILGKEVEAFEKEFSSFLNSGPVVGVANGTDALVLALRGLGLKPGAGVVTVAHTATATVAAIELAGGVPVFTDIDPVWMVMDPQKLSDSIREYQREGKTPLQAVVAVHLYGQPADMEGIRTVCRKEGLLLVEDCAQSAGAAWAGRKTGTWGDAASFSFYPTKNLGALGDGGAVVTGDPAVAKRVRMLREYGWSQRNMSRFPGMNSRLDEIQAAILRVKLKALAQENKKRNALARIYHHEVRNEIFRMLQERSEAENVYHLFPVRTEKRNKFREFLKKNKIGSNIHYPVPIHRMPGYRGKFWLPYKGLPETEKAAGEVLSLPLYPEMSLQNAKKISTVANRFN